MYFNKVLLIDNYDSFTFNLLHIIEQFCEVDVFRNDSIQIKNLADYDAIVFSPGPGLPKESASMLQIIDKFKFQKPMLGVCLGHQAIAEHFGCELINLNSVRHGVDVEVKQILPSKLFRDIPKKIKVGLYHSWAIKESAVPPEIIITVKSEEGVVMAFKHKKLPIFGVQFHPESVMTKHGKKIIENFLKH